MSKLFGKLLIDALRHLCRIGIRLLLGDPERSAGNAAGEILKLDAMEVLQTDKDIGGLDFLKAERRLFSLEFKKNTVF